MSNRIKFEGKEYLETSEGGIRLGDLKISTGLVTSVTHNHGQHPYRGRPTIETDSMEISTKYYRETPLTFEEWIASEAAPKIGTIKDALRLAFEAGQKLGGKS